MLLVQIALFDDFALFDALGPYDVLTAGALFSRGAVAVELAAVGGPRDVRSGPAGLAIRASAALDPARADVLLVPGAATAVAAELPEALARAARAGIGDAAARALARPGAIVAAVCGGSLLLGAAGLVRDRAAVTNRTDLGALASAGARPVNARIVDDGNLVTAAGVTSGLDLGIYLLERTVGPQIAVAVEQLFEHERRGTVFTSRGPAPAAL